MTREGSATFAEERRAAIMAMLERMPSVQVSDLAATFGVSTVTARADLDALAAAGRLRRTHGGAVSLRRRLVVSTQDRRVNVNVGAKRAIARAAARLVNEDDTLLLDSGTTALEFTRALAGLGRLTVITPDITIANLVDETLPAVDVIMLAGTLRKGHRYVYGPLALQALAAVHADLAVVCPGSFVRSRGLMTEFAPMAELKAALMAAASRRVALLDSSKASDRGTYRFAGLTDVEVVVMDDAPGARLVAETIEGLPEGGPRPRLVLAPLDEDAPDTRTGA